MTVPFARLTPTDPTLADRLTRWRYSLQRDLEAVHQLTALVEEIRAIAPRGNVLIHELTTAAVRGEPENKENSEKAAAFLARLAALGEHLEKIRTLQKT